ncbi:hypothetical protein ACFU44_13770 [Nocardia rhizosphaerihabitans]|uniref:hypothetical protein n=1 Tax=Nocardia rhizosphaerihabitans TaxID=1691570 RepID=UPI00366CDBF4
MVKYNNGLKFNDDDELIVAGAGTVADGADVNAGATTDAPNTTGATGTMSGKLRGIVTILADVWDDATNLFRVREQYAPVYEDNTAGKAVVEHRYTPSYSVTADTLVKTGAGLVHTATFSCNDAAPTAGDIVIYDNTSETGSVLFKHTFTTTPFAPFTVVLDQSFATGLYVGFTTTNDVNVSISFR